MSKIIATAAIRGAHALVGRAETALNEAIAAKGEAEPFALPDTAYYLPVTYAMTGQKCKTLGDLKPIIEKAKALCERLEDKAVAAARATDKQVREHPYEAIGIALGLGVLIGVLVARSRRD